MDLEKVSADWEELTTEFKKLEVFLNYITDR